MAARRKRKSTSGSPMGWFVGGLVIGLGGAVLLFTQGFIPGAPEREPAPTPVQRSEEPPLLEAPEEEERSAYDFFTVLPEMEVVVPERELEQQAAPDTPEPANADEEQAFILQVGSFRSAADAEAMKARLALLGSVANIQTVTVDGSTWHRVRVGPVSGPRAADRLRRQLQDDGIDVLVVKAGR
jgi:cell division protein FtsN